MSDAQPPAEAGSSVEGGAAPVAPPVSISGLLGEGNVLLASGGVDPIGTYTVLKTWTIHKGKCTVGRVRAVVEGVEYFGICHRAEVGAAFKGLTKAENIRRSVAGYKRNAPARQVEYEARQVERAQYLAQKAAASSAAAGVDPQAVIEGGRVPLPDPNFAVPGDAEEVVRRIRRAVVDTLRAIDLDGGYRVYAQVKYEGTDDPGIVQRRRAYVVAFERLLDKAYQEPGG